MFEMHSTIRNNLVISTQKPVYWDLPVGKLEERAMVSGLNVPLQQGFDCDSETGFPVRIDYLPAITFEERIVGTMSFCQSTAVAAPFARMPAINNFKNNIFIKTPAFKQLPKFIEGDSHHLFIEPLAFWAEPLEVFNRNVGTKPQSQFSYLLDNLAKPIFDKIELFVFKSFKTSLCFAASFVCKRLEFFFSFKNLFSFNPNVFSKISLFQNFSFRRKNRNSKALAIDVYPQNILSLRQFDFSFGEINDNLSAGSQPVCLALPVAGNEKGISLEVLVLFYGDSNSLFGIHPELDKKIGFSTKGLAISGVVEFDSDSLDGFSLAFNDVAFNVADNLGIERGVFLAG